MSAVANFWAVDGEVIGKQTNIEVEGGGNNLDMPIPAGRMVRAMVDDVLWKTQDNEGTFINIKWKVVAPECYAGRVIFQKVHVRCMEFRHAGKWKGFTDEKMKVQRIKFLKMLATIDTNAGGKLLSVPDMPTDERLQACLSGKEMCLTMEVWENEIDRNTGQRFPNRIDYGRGNWVKAVAPKAEFKGMSKEEQEAEVAKTEAVYKKMLEEAGGQRTPRPQGGGQGGGGQPQQQQRPASDFDSFDDDIPF
jgi:hypothetical protein